ncbi:CBS domain-containing protein [Sulfurovum sp.]|uniref:CBS domain-containing protein n=1 Tax=Sulfurovum sp. TaxID=1969726 RepID=UPI0025FF4707|nr:CBS domain-containing protein [Sulfurovum sp.]
MTALSSIAHTKGFTIDSNATISEAMACMLSNGNGVAVLLKDKKPLGIVTESLLLAHMEALDHASKVIVLAKCPVISAHKNRPVESAFDMVVTNNIRRLILVDDKGLYFGIVLQEDLFDFLEEDVYKIDLKVADLLPPDVSVISIGEDATLHDALSVMRDKHIGSVIVVDGKEKTVGIVTEKDILSAGYRHIDMHQNIGQVMSSPVLSVSDQSPVTDVISLMRSSAIRRVVVTHRDGRMRALLTNRDIFQHIKGNVARMLEIKLRHAKEIMNLLPEAIIEIFDIPGQQVIHWMNRRAQTLFGKELVEQHPVMLMGDLSWNELYSELREKEIIQNNLVLIKGKSFEFSGTLSQNINSRYIKLIAKDVTEHEAAKQILKDEINEEIRLRRENEYLMMQQARMASMGETVGYIAHQWRQPLAQLGGILMNLESSYLFGELDKPYLEEKIQQGNAQIKYMSQTIDDFRLFFRPNQEPEAFDIADAVRQSVQIVSASLNYYHIEVKTKFKKGRFFAVGYPNEFSQAILNLINNARDALSKKTADPKTIAITIREQGDKTEILVCDNGGGINPKLLSSLFEPYVTGRRESGGTGVGLYITRLIVEQKMKGKIEASNNSDGACFRIFLPGVS